MLPHVPEASTILSRIADFFAPRPTIYALCGRDIEFNFVLLDGITGKPIPGAVLNLLVEDHKKKQEDWEKIRLDTDHDGRAKILRKDSMCEDVIRTNRKTVTLIDRGWCMIYIQAPGYAPLEYLYLDNWPCKDLGYISAEKLQRVEIKIELVPPKRTSASRG